MNESREDYDRMSVDELRALARDLISRLPDDAARRLLDDVIRDRSAHVAS